MIVETWHVLQDPAILFICPLSLQQSFHMHKMQAFTTSQNDSRVLTSVFWYQGTFIQLASRPENKQWCIIVDAIVQKQGNEELTNRNQMAKLLVYILLWWFPAFKTGRPWRRHWDGVKLLDFTVVSMIIKFKNTSLWYMQPTEKESQNCLRLRKIIERFWCTVFPQD